MFFQYNTSLGPPFRVLVDTNFINFSIKNKVWGVSRDPTTILPPESRTTAHNPTTTNICTTRQLEMYKAMMDCLLAKCTPCVSDCVMAELEKLGAKYTLALRCVFLCCRVVFL